MSLFSIRRSKNSNALVDIFLQYIFSFSKIGIQLKLFSLFLRNHLTGTQVDIDTLSVIGTRL